MRNRRGTDDAEEGGRDRGRPGEEVGAVLSASTHQVIDSAERDAAAAGATRHRNP